MSVENRPVKPESEEHTDDLEIWLESLSEIDDAALTRVLGEAVLSSRYQEWSHLAVDASFKSADSCEEEARSEKVEITAKKRTQLGTVPGTKSTQVGTQSMRDSPKATSNPTRCGAVKWRYPGIEWKGAEVKRPELARRGTSFYYDSPEESRRRRRGARRISRRRRRRLLGGANHKGKEP